MSEATAVARRVPLGTDGKPMSPWQIWLKRLCIVMIVWALVEIAVGLAAIVVSHVAAGAVVAGIDVRTAAATVGTSALLSATLNLLIGLLGIRGAENPNKIALFFWITLADAVLTAWALASSLSSGIVDPTGIVSGLFIIALAVCAWQVRGQTGYFDVHP